MRLPPAFARHCQARSQLGSNTTRKRLCSRSSRWVHEDGLLRALVWLEVAGLNARVRASTSLYLGILFDIGVNRGGHFAWRGKAAGCQAQCGPFGPSNVQANPNVESLFEVGVKIDMRCASCNYAYCEEDGDEFRLRPMCMVDLCARVVGENLQQVLDRSYGLLRASTTRQMCLCCGVTGRLQEMRSLGGDPPQWVLLRPLLFGLKGERLLQGAPDWSFSNSLQILGTRYVVRSAIHHAGSSPTTGHYTASVYMDDGTILSLDGGRVREIAQPEVSTSSASLLLCQRVHGAKYVHEWLVPRRRCVWRVDVG